MSNEFLDYVEDIIIIHGYDNVNMHIMWDVIKQEIPKIKPHLQQILQDYEGE